MGGKTCCIIATAVALSTATQAAAAAPHSPAGGPTVCTWAGTPDAPTGTFTIDPGTTNTPSARPSRFVATGRLAGGGPCHGTMTWTGQVGAGSSCALAFFDGTVHGLPGVAAFHGAGTFTVPSRLYDRAGRLVGVENAEILTQANSSHFGDCSTPGGFRGGWPGMFSSVVVLYGS